MKAGVFRVLACATVVACGFFGAGAAAQTSSGQAEQAIALLKKAQEAARKTDYAV